MGPSRHTRSAANAAARSEDSASAPASSSALTSTAASSRTPTRGSPYTRTPTKPSSSALTLGPSTPTSRTSSPMMLREIFSMISPFRGHSKARRSAAFGAADEMEAEEEQSAQAVQPTRTPLLEDVQEDVDTEDRMIEDAEEGVSKTTSVSRKLLDIPSSSRPVSRSPSPRPRSPIPMPEPLKSLPLADSELVTPGLRRQVDNLRPDVFISTPGPSTSYAPPPQQQMSPVSRNYDLLARFFSEKQRGGQGGLTEVEVEGCIRLIEESMATDRNLESEFAGNHSSSHGRQYPSMQASDYASSSRASSIAPPSSAMPVTQSMGNLFHPGTNRMPASSNSFSFLAPRAAASQSFRPFGAPTLSAPRRRPIYLGPGMSGLSLHRRRPVISSASRAATLAGSQGQGFVPRSSTDPNLARHARNDDDTIMQDASDRAAGLEDAKRRRTAAAADFGSPAQSRSSIAGQTVQFDPTYEKQARQSSMLAKDIAASSSSTIPGASGSPLKRAAPTAEPVKTSPQKATTRTASAIQDILKSSPPVRPPTKPELVNPYQQVAPLPARSRKLGDNETLSSTPVRRSARSSMLTRAKERKTAKAAEKSSPPKETVLELIERTAPKTAASKRKATSDATEDQRNGRATTAPSSTASAASTAASATMEEQRKLQKTEEVQRRLEAPDKARTDQQAAAKPTAADASSSQKAAGPIAKAASAASLVPPQYTATKPKKPSPLSAAFQVPDSPSSDSESAPAQSRGPAIAKPSFNLGSSSASTSSAAKPQSAPFSFSAPKPSAPPALAAASAPAPSSGSFSFSEPAVAAPPAAAPSSAPSTGSTFSPITPASSQPQTYPKPAAITPASTFNFSAPVAAPAPAASSSSAEASSPRSEVLAEDASKLPKFEWQVPAPSTSAAADKALRDEIKSVAQSALPKFDFIYEVKTATASGDKKRQGVTAAAPVEPAAPAPSAGFSFSAPSAAPAPAQTAASSAASSGEDRTSGSDDPSKNQSSGPLGEGEGEESESTLHEVRAKIWSLDPPTKAWKDLGVCVAKLKHNSETGKHRLLARNEANGKVAVNFMTYKGLKTKLESTVNTFLGFEGKEPMTYRVKVKTEDMSKELKEKLEGASA
ncbi:hypothetical protein NDA13_004172 [Ustilago tritici]|nr:hypothetical protein NDA13_004172 [Ustilago tritici]